MKAPFKAECSVKMLRFEYEGNDPAGALRAVGETIGSIVGGTVEALNPALMHGGIDPATATPLGTPGTQRTLQELRTEQAGPRTARPRAVVRDLAHADARDLAEATVAGSTDPVRDAALRRLRELLCDYLAGLGVNAAFQAVNFTTWLDTTGQRPINIDMRCLGGMWSGLLRNGFIVAIGHQPDGGNPHSPGDKHNSATRPVFRIARIPTP